MGTDPEPTLKMTVEATLVVDDVQALAAWVLDHIPDNSNYDVMTDWVDPEYAPDHDGDEPEPQDVIASDAAVYSMDSALDMLWIAAELLPGLVPGIQVDMMACSVDEAE